MAAQLDFSALGAALGALTDALAVVDDHAWFDAQPMRVRNTLVSGAVQSVEFVYELSIKSLRRCLEAMAENVDTIDAMSYRDLIRTAAEKQLIDDVPAWFSYRDMRNITSHTYDGAKARQVLELAPGFLGAANRLYASLQAAHV